MPSFKRIYKQFIHAKPTQGMGLIPPFRDRAILDRSGRRSTFLEYALKFYLNTSSLSI